MNFKKTYLNTKSKIKLKINFGIVFIVLSTIITLTITTGIIAIMGKSNQNRSVNQQAKNSFPATPVGPAAVDSSIFDKLLGKPAPDFTLEDYKGTKFQLSSLKGEKVLLFFSEGIMCYPACWNQIAAFGTRADLNNDMKVLNIVVDSKDQWKNAVNKMPELALAVVLFDTDRKVSSQYGMMNLPSSMHKGKLPGHTYVLLDKNGIVRWTKDDVQMAVRNKEISNESKGI